MRDAGEKTQAAAAEVLSRYSFPAADCSRIPYGMYRDADIYELEQARIFRGPVWNYLALECEIPNPGDFRVVTVGETEVIVNRGKDNAIHAMVNRCAHRGAIVQRQLHGNTKVHTCCYHQWSFDLQGRLVGVPFQKGVNGVGGLPADFEKSCHGLNTLRVATLNGVIFGTFSQATEDLESFLDPAFVAQIRRLFHKPVKILGYHRQRIFGNWKLYSDNVRDPNHGGLLHMFQVAFGIARLGGRGGAMLDREGKHNMTWGEQSFNAEAKQPDDKNGYAATDRGDMEITLRDPSLIPYRKEFPDNLSITITTIFPNCTFQQIGNTLAVRQFRTHGPGECEIHSTLYGFADDDAETTQDRLRKANLAGPAGLVSMEDGEAVELVYRAILHDKQDHATVEFGGRGPAVSQDSMVTDVPVRGFWMHYCKLMGIEPGEAH